MRAVDEDVRDMWTDIPEEVCVAFDCGPHRTVRGNVTALLTFVEAYAGEVEGELERAHRVWRRRKGYPDVEAAFGAFDEARVERDDTIDALASEAARFALRGLHEVRVALSAVQAAGSPPTAIIMGGSSASDLGEGVVGGAPVVEDLLQQQQQQP